MVDIDEKKAVLEFLKEAWCIDGEVKPLPTVEGLSLLGTHDLMVFELNDSERGKFYIANFMEKEDKK